MSSSEKNITSKWPETMKRMQNRHPGYMKPNVFNDLYGNIIVGLIKSLDSNCIKEFQVADNDGRELLGKKLGDTGQSEQFKSIFANYSNLYDRYKSLTDTKKQEESTVTWDHVKTLFFRTLTTLMIAVVVLATGYIAHRYEIPLPLLRSL